MEQLVTKLKYLRRNVAYCYARKSLISRCKLDAGLRKRFTRNSSTVCDSATEPINVEFKNKVRTGPSLQHFIASSASYNGAKHLSFNEEKEPNHPYVNYVDIAGNDRTVYFDVYGCQMNVNDTEIAWSILKASGFKRTTDITDADVILVMTCAIRDGAEQKVWNRLQYLKSLKQERQKLLSKPSLKLGILGCMAERLKHKLIEREKMVDLVAGPDSYKDLPRMLSVTTDGQTAVNVILSLDETYADVIPVRLNEKSRSAFVSIMRGCNNMCTYCIVPFTRGRERSRPMSSIVDEVKLLSDQGYKEVTLLGQNVNSYCDTSESHFVGGMQGSEPTHLSRGFKTIYKPIKGGFRFANLLEKVSDVDPEMRIRFTSPHPKDFPDEVLHLIHERPNICKQIHLPAQSGSSKILKAMRRGYTREAYLDLVSHVRSLIPDISLSSDFICGFCGESEEDFEETLTLIHSVKYNFAYLFPYSMREKTAAHRRLAEDLPQAIKLERLGRMVTAFRQEAEMLNSNAIGKHQVVLVEGRSKRSASDLAGRNDGNTKVIFPNAEIGHNINSNITKPIVAGDYVMVKINAASSQVLKGIPLFHTRLQEASKLFLDSQQKLEANINIL